MESKASGHKTITTQKNECQTVHDSARKSHHNPRSALEETKFFIEFFKFCSIGTTILISVNKETTECVLKLLRI